MQTVLISESAAYDLVPGTGGPWSTSMCRSMIAGTTPRVVPDTAVVPALAEAVGVAARLSIPVGAYVRRPGQDLQFEPNLISLLAVSIPTIWVTGKELAKVVRALKK